MDIQTPDHTTPRSAGSPGQPSPNFIAHLMHALGAATDQQRDATRELFEALDPRDPADAQLAAIAVAAAQSAMDNFARAARPASPTKPRCACAAVPSPPGAPTPRHCVTFASRRPWPRSLPSPPDPGPRQRPPPAPACGTRRRDTGNSTRLHRTATRRHADPRRVPPAGSLRQRDPGLAPRSDDPRAGACRVLLSPRSRPGRRSDRKRKQQ